MEFRTILHPPGPNTRGRRDGEMKDDFAALQFVSPYKSENHGREMEESDV